MCSRSQVIFNSKFNRKMFVKPSNPFPHFRSKSLNVKSSFMVKNEIKDNVPLKKKTI